MYSMIIARGYPTDKYKMNGIFEWDQAKALSDNGVKVVYCALDMRSARRWRKWGIEKKLIEGIPVYAVNIPCGRIPVSFRNKLALWGFNKVYKHILREQGEPNLLHAHFVKMGLIAKDIKEKIKRPLVLTEHLSALMNKDISQTLFQTAEQTYKVTDSLITVSQGLQEVIKEKFNQESTYIPNIVDTTLFNYHPSPESEQFTFISIGSLIPRKRMDLTIQAFIQAFESNENVKLIIYGEGPEKKLLNQLIDNHAMTDRIILKGLRSRKEISEDLNNSQCFVLASQAETFGVVFIEALSAGIPVVATKSGGPESFINETNGMLVEKDSVDALSSALRHMYGNIHSFDRQSISEKTEKMFSPKVVSEQIKDVYRKTLENNIN